MLQVAKYGSKDRGIVSSDGNQINLRGVCIGGYMNMENFINGFPGTENRLRNEAARQMGPRLAGDFFEDFHDNFFGEDDVKYIKSLGANVIRLPLNYRHFEDDDKPFQYKSSGFKRVDKVVDWCTDNGLYVILDMHAAQGGQNYDWHADNHVETAQLFDQKQFQDRYFGLWRELAGRYRDNPTIAGYDILKNRQQTCRIINRVLIK